MKQFFDPGRALIMVPVRLWGPAGAVKAALVLDTGAVSTVISRDMAALLGFEAVDREPAVQVITGGGEVTAHRLQVHRIAALGHERSDFPVLCHSLPRKARVDGLLGLSFLRGRRLVVDLLAGWVNLE